MQNETFPKETLLHIHIHNFSSKCDSAEFSSKRFLLNFLPHT